MKKKISAKIIADSIDGRGNRIISYILTYPRIIHGEFMTHRMFSRNAASSRAIPFEKMVKDIEEDPFIPIAWQKAHKGMQGTEYITSEYGVKEAKGIWLWGMREAVKVAKELHSQHNQGVTKQLCNRLLEPFQWMITLVTATEYDDFFELRCPQYAVPLGMKGTYEDARFEIFKSRNDAIKKYPEDTYPVDVDDEWKNINASQAEIHIQALAEAMWDAKNESTPRNASNHLTRWKSYWHIPFITEDVWKDLGITYDNEEEIIKVALKIATARCARLSYMTFDGEIDYEKDIQLHDRLLESKHFSPFEHCARAMSDDAYHDFINGEGVQEHGGHALFFYDDDRGWCNNFRGFIPYRYLVENE